tara:strand:- start:609 stop:893 length:285 start_codon:yes stop_codon:yes gene_type:complete
MLIRKCAKDHKVYIFKPRTKENVSYKFSESETVSFDAQNKSYVITNDGSVVKRTNSWETAEKEYLKQCKTFHSDISGRIKVGESTFENGVYKAL